MGRLTVPLLVAALIGCTQGHAYKSICELITSNNYQCELHGPVTPDGFELGLNRIPPKHKGAPVVLLQHGLLDSSATFLNNLPHQSLGYILHDQGFDVWLSNSRGNSYSQVNHKFKRHDKRYWDLVDWDLMAKYDLPTNIDYILAQTGAPKLAYVGHSQGTIQAFAAFAKNYGDVSNKVTVFAALAPVAYVRHQRSEFMRLLADADLPWLLEKLGDKQFLPNSKILQDLGIACDIVPRGCDMLLFVVVGPSPTWNMNGSRIDYYLNWEPADTSTHNMIHWAQGVKHEWFREFDWGLVGNELHYHHPTPPRYDLSKVTVPVGLFSGGNDYLADPKDVAQMTADLGSAVVLQNYQPEYAHMDFVWGLNAHTKIYPNVTQLILDHKP